MPSLERQTVLPVRVMSVLVPALLTVIWASSQRIRHPTGIHLLLHLHMQRVSHEVPSHATRRLLASWHSRGTVPVRLLVHSGLLRRT
jgi:hypothetical protein